MSTVAVKLSQLTELTTITDDDLLLVSDIEGNKSHKVKYSTIGASMQVGALSGVDTTGIQAGQVLQWNGTSFVPATISAQIVDEDGNITIDLTPLDNLHLKLGVGSTETHMGDFPGSRLPDGSTIKEIFLAIETTIDNLYRELQDDAAEIASVETGVVDLNVLADERQTQVTTLQADLNTLIATTDAANVSIGSRLDALEGAGFLSSIPTEYVTEAELAAEGFIKTVDFTGYATETYVTNAIAAIPATDLTGYATETYVDNAIGDLTLAGIAGITGTPGEGQILKWTGNGGWGFAPDIDTDTDTNVDLTGYATEAWVQAQGYSTGGGGGGITLTDVANAGYVTGNDAVLKTDTEFQLTDNQNDAFDFREGNNVYLRFNTYNSGEKVQILKDLWVAEGIHTADYIRLDGDNKELKFYNTGGTGKYLGLKAPTGLTADQVFTLPGTDGTNGQVLTTDGAGNLGFGYSCCGRWWCYNT